MSTKEIEYCLQYGKENNAVVLMRTDISYEAIGQDAKVLEKTLRYVEKHNSITYGELMLDYVSFPKYHFEMVLPVLIRAGFRVAILNRDIVK